MQSTLHWRHQNRGIAYLNDHTTTRLPTRNANRNAGFHPFVASGMARASIGIQSHRSQLTLNGMAKITNQSLWRMEMKKFIWSLLALVAVATSQTVVKADHNYGPASNNSGSAYSPEQSYHSGLTHRATDRQSTHDQAHSLGLNSRQHNSLHQSLSHESLHDNQAHANFDNNYGRSPYGNQSFGSGYSGQQQYSTRAYSANPYATNMQYGNQYSGSPYSNQSYSGGQYNGSQYSTSPYSANPYSSPGNMGYGNGFQSTYPRW